MGGKDYIPSSDIGFDAWFDKFTAYVVAHATQLGVSAMEVSTLVAKNADWNTGYGAHISATVAVRGTKEMKDNLRKNGESYARDLSQRITTYSGTNDADREAMELTVRDTEPTALSEDVVINATPPTVYIDHSQPRIAIVHFGDNPKNENENAKPYGIKGAKIWFHMGGLPTGGEKWEFLADDTNSPYNHIINNDVGITVAYRAQWFDRRLRLGPLGDPIVVAISA